LDHDLSFIDSLRADGKRELLWHTFFSVFIGEESIKQMAKAGDTPTHIVG